MSALPSPELDVHPILDRWDALRRQAMVPVERDAAPTAEVSHHLDALQDLGEQLYGTRPDRALLLQAYHESRFDGDRPPSGGDGAIAPADDAPTPGWFQRWADRKVARDPLRPVWNLLAPDDRQIFLQVLRHLSRSFGSLAVALLGTASAVCCFPFPALLTLALAIPLALAGAGFARGAWYAALRYRGYRVLPLPQGSPSMGAWQAWQWALEKDTAERD
jgi:hypothetical protein